MRISEPPLASAEGIIFSAALCGDGETCRNRHSELAHFGKVGTLAAEEFSHVSIAFGGLSSEAINAFLVVEHISYLF